MSLDKLGQDQIMGVKIESIAKMALAYHFGPKIMQAIGVAMFIVGWVIYSIFVAVTPHTIDAQWIDDEVYQIENRINDSDGFTEHDKSLTESQLRHIYEEEFTVGINSNKFSDLRNADLWVKRTGLSQERAEFIAGVFNSIW